MTEERSNPDNDPLVSRLYRESATETVPDAVDNAVLREAGRAASGGAWDRYSKSIHWLRPMAWATTVALSLAIVIEVVDTPYVDGDAAKFGALESQLETPEAEAPRIDANARGGRLERKTEAGPATVADEVSVGRTAKQVDTGIFVNQDPGMLRQAEEQARERVSADQPAATPGTAASAAFLLAVPCDDEETSEPESWLECIERLDEAGRYADAARQRELLEEAFPDFEPEENND